MKIGDFPLVETLVDLRTTLTNQIARGVIAIEIDGKRMNPDFVQAIEPSIRLELRHRITDIEARLTELGVIFERA